MGYTRELLTAKNRNIEQHQAITQDLLNKLTDEKKLTVAEARYVCSQLRLMRNVEDDSKIIDAVSFPQCVDMIFLDKYLLYFENHEGYYQAFDYNGEILLEQKKMDVDFLNQHFLSWEKDVILNTRLKDQILRHIAIETNRQIKALGIYRKEKGFGYVHYKHLYKGILLHSKFLYYAVLEYYEEGNAYEEAIDICNHKFVVDSYVYIHVLFRHYAATVKEHQQGKSYHSIEYFDYKNLPKDIYLILDKYSKVVDCSLFDREKFFFKIDNVSFAIWYKEIEFNKRGKEKEKIMQIQTLYPIIEQRDFEKISKLQEVKFDRHYTFYI